MRVLFADDNDDTRTMFRLVFEISGHSVRTASNGAEAVEWAQKEEFDVSVLDVEMPVLNGLEALRMLREKEAPATFPIVMFTAYRDNEIERVAHQYGAKEIIYKPILPAAFVKQIEDIVHAS